MVVSIASTELSDTSWRPVSQGLFLFWDVFGAHVLGYVLGLFCGSCKGLMFWDVTGAHVVARVRDSCCETCSGTML